VKRVILLISLLTFPIIAYAAGKAAAIDYKEKNWTLCVTAFDSSKLPSAQSVTSETIQRIITNNLQSLDYKLRSTGEYDYYWSVAWLAAQNVEAKKLAAKQQERDRLYFQGYSAWRYKREIKRVDGEIEVLRQALENAELSSPNIATIPHFAASSDNLKGIFPAPPAKGREASFCKSQNVNGFLRGNASIYHGRLLVEVELWTVWSRSYVYKDNVIFSIEDIDQALYEFSTRFINTISGMEYSVLVVKADPSDSIIIVDDKYISNNGQSGEIHRTPGPVEINVYAKNHEPQSETVNLYEAGRTEIGFTLYPIPQGSFTVTTKKGEKANVYQGAMFVGQTPLTLTGPLDGFGQISIETEDNNKGEYRTAQTIFQIEDKTSVKIAPKKPAPTDRIEKARKRFYGAYGRLWIGLPVALMLLGVSESYVNAFNSVDWDKYPDLYDEKYPTAVFWSRTMPISAGIGIGVLAADVIIHLILYVYQANRSGAILIQKDKSNKNNSTKINEEVVNTSAETTQ
jgi:DNA-binding winged helix-turn-helix (wHTH) protein